MATRNAVLATGLAMEILKVCTTRLKGNMGITLSQITSGGDGPGALRGDCADSRVPSLLVGWGIGYWVTSLLFVLAVSWHGNGWTNASVVVILLGYVVLPVLLVSSAFMIAELNVLADKNWRIS